MLISWLLAVGPGILPRSSPVLWRHCVHCWLSSSARPVLLRMRITNGTGRVLLRATLKNWEWPGNEARCATYLTSLNMAESHEVPTLNCWISLALFTNVSNAAQLRSEATSGRIEAVLLDPTLVSAHLIPWYLCSCSASLIRISESFRSIKYQTSDFIGLSHSRLSNDAEPVLIWFGEITVDIPMFALYKPLYLQEDMNMIISFIRCLP